MRPNEKRLTPEKQPESQPSSSNPPAYSDFHAPIAAGNEDEQLLARLGYKQVGSLNERLRLMQLLTAPGTSPRVQQMVDCIVRHLSPWSPRIAASYIWRPAWSGWTCNGGMGLVHRLLHVGRDRKFRR